jgi:hypothetical protein
VQADEPDIAPLLFRRYKHVNCIHAGRDEPKASQGRGPGEYRAGACIEKRAQIPLIGGRQTGMRQVHAGQQALPRATITHLVPDLLLAQPPVEGLCSGDDAVLPAQQRGKCLVVVLTQTRHTGSLTGIGPACHECEPGVAL